MKKYWAGFVTTSFCAFAGLVMVLAAVEAICLGAVLAVAVLAAGLGHLVGLELKGVKGEN